MPSFEDDYLDVLQNIEFVIVQIYHRDPELVDYQVEKALDALIQAYRRPNSPVDPRLHSNRLAKEVFEAVKGVCDWRLGSAAQDTAGIPVPPIEIEPLEPDEIVACLKRIRKSVQLWNKQGGRRGYLEFIDPYVV